MLAPDQVVTMKQDLSNIARPVSGIYFLIDCDRIVYVGRAVNVRRRLGQHKHDAVKQYTHYAYVRCEASDLIDTEADYITVFSPPNTPVHSRRWFTLRGMEMITTIPIEHYRAYVVQRGLTTINGHYCVADFAELHATHPGRYVRWNKDGVLSEDYAWMAGGRYAHIFAQLGMVWTQDIRWTRDAVRALLIKRGVWHSGIVCNVETMQTMDAIAQGNAHEDVVAELWPEGQEVTP